MADLQYYTAREAQEKLGLSKAVFHRKVNAGLVPKVTPPGMKQGVYLKRDIDALALSMQMIFELPMDKIHFSKSSPGDQVEELDIGVKCFGSEFITPLPERIAFQQKNEYTFWSLKAYGKVVGYLSMFRFVEVFLDDLLTGRKIERQITLQEMLKFERLVPFNVYIDVLAVDPALPLSARHYYGGLIVTRFADVLLDLRANGYFIEKLFTVSATKEGDTLIRKLGFHLMEGKSLVPGRIAYEFPLDEAGIKQLEHFSRRGIS